MALWIANSAGREVFEFADPTDLAAFVRRMLPAAFNSPEGLSFDSQGHLWIVDSLGGEVFEFADPTDLTAFVQRNLPSTLTTPQGLSFDRQGHLWIVAAFSDEVFEFADPTDLTAFVQRNLPSTLQTPGGLSFDRQGHLWIADTTGDEVFEFADPTDLTAFVQRALPAALTNPQGLSFDSQGHMSIVDTISDDVFEFADPTDLTVFVQRNLPSTLTNPLGTSFDDRGFATDFSVDADPVAVAYAVPAAAVTHTAAPDIAIADFDQAGLRPPIVLAVFLADISGNFLTGSSNNVDPIEGEIEVSPTLTFGRIERRGANNIRLYRDSGSTDPASDYFDDPGSPLYPTAKLYIQTTAGRAEYDAGNGVNNANFFLASGEDATIVSGIATGGYFLIAIAEPAVEHAVNADPTAVAYAVPAAAITHTPRTLLAHAVDADPVTVAYAVPQPGGHASGPDSRRSHRECRGGHGHLRGPSAERLAYGGRLLPRRGRWSGHGRLRGPTTHRHHPPCRRRRSRRGHLRRPGRCRKAHAGGRRRPGSGHLRGAGGCCHPHGC